MPPGLDGLEAKRKVVIPYRGAEIPDVEITSLSDEFDHRLSSFLKEQAVRNEWLAAVEIEDMLGLTHTGAAANWTAMDNCILSEAILKTKF